MILVTGSTGKVGQQLVTALQHAGARFAALARSEASAKDLAARGVPVVRGDFGDGASMRQALSGIERLFLLSSGADPFAAEAAAVAAARTAGVRRIVKLSAMGASADSSNSFLRGHGRIERMLDESGLLCTYVRPTFFMQNWVLYNAPAVRAGRAGHALDERRDHGFAIRRDDRRHRFPAADRPAPRRYRHCGSRW